MGRTLRTYRMRLNQIREKYGRLFPDSETMWTAAHRLSAPASAFPWPDTAIALHYSILIDIFANIIKLEEALDGKH